MQSTPRNRLLATTVLSMFAAVCVAVAPRLAAAETLADAIALAYETNPGIQAARAQLRVVNENYVQARAAAGLQASAQVEFAEGDMTVSDTGRKLDGQATTLNLGVSQPIFAGGRIAAATDAAAAEVLAARERLRQAETDLVLRVIAAYAAVRRDQQILQVSIAAQQVLQGQLDEVEAKVEVKENTRTDLAQSQARAAINRSQLATYEAQLEISRAQYLAQVGQNPGDLAPEPELTGLPATIDAAFDAVEQNNPTLSAARRTEQASRSRIAEARARHLPSVNLQVQATRAPNTLFNPRPYYEAVQARATVTQPLFTSGLNASQLRKALAQNNSDRLSIDAARRTAVQALSSNWSQLAAARRSLTADEAAIDAAEAAFFGMRQEERFGLRSTIELLNAQQELQQAQTNMLRNRYTEYTARAAVLGFMGVLDAEAIAPGVKVFDPQTDFDHVKWKYALPTELVVRAVDGLVSTSGGPALKPRETTVPDKQAVLPPTPSEEVLHAPIRSAADVMRESKEATAGE